MSFYACHGACLKSVNTLRMSKFFERCDFSKGSLGSQLSQSNSFYTQQKLLCVERLIAWINAIHLSWERERKRLVFRLENSSNVNESIRRQTNSRMSRLMWCNFSRLFFIQVSKAIRFYDVRTYVIFFVAWYLLFLLSLKFARFES